MEREGLAKSTGNWESIGKDQGKRGGILPWEREKQKQEQDHQEMIDEFDKMMGEALLENFVEIMEYDEKQMEKLEREVRDRWNGERTEREREGDGVEATAGAKRGNNNGTGKKWK